MSEERTEKPTARKKKENAYLSLILQAYHAQPAESFKHLHGRKAHDPAVLQSGVMKGLPPLPVAAE